MMTALVGAAVAGEAVVAPEGEGLDAAQPVEAAAVVVE